LHARYVKLEKYILAKLIFEVIDSKVRKNVVYIIRGQVDLFGGTCHGAAIMPEMILITTTELAL
jgi:hypothetical protein